MKWLATEPLGGDQRGVLRLTSKAQPAVTRRADLKREVLAALCPGKRWDRSFSNEPKLEATSKKKGSLPAHQSVSANVFECLTKRARAARAKPCPPPRRRPPSHRERSNAIRETTRRQLSPWDPSPPPTVDKAARVLIETGTGQRIEDIRGPTRTLEELTKQLTIIATVLTAARASQVPPPGAVLP